MIRIEDIFALHELKYRYFRFLDGKQWDELAECFSTTATAAYDRGKYSFEGREAILGFLRGALGSHEIVSVHNGYNPEIRFTGEDSAEGTWRLEDYLIFREMKTRLRGAAIYSDRYVREAGIWRIAHTGYVRLFEEMRQNDSQEWTLTSFGNHLEP